MHKGVRFRSISFVIRLVEQLSPFLSCLVAFVSSASVIGSFLSDTYFNSDTPTATCYTQV